MPNKPGSPRRNVLGKYEGMNLLFFLTFILVLGGFVGWVFQSYKDRNTRPAKTLVDEGIISEVVSETSGTCLFYLGTTLSENSRKYSSRADVPPTDDGMIRDFLAIPGVVQVTVDRRLIVLSKSPSVYWEAIQPGAREIIRNHFHMHH